MNKEDSIKLLNECHSGIAMGVDAINDVLPTVQETQLKQLLTMSKQEHEKLNIETSRLLSAYDEQGKKPGAVAKGMSWIKTNLTLSMDPTDDTVAELITDGCNMGVKSLHQVLNDYPEADSKAKEITQKIISLEEKLAVDLRPYL